MILEKSGKSVQKRHLRSIECVFDSTEENDYGAIITLFVLSFRKRDFFTKRGGDFPVPKMEFSVSLQFYVTPKLKNHD